MKSRRIKISGVKLVKSKILKNLAKAKILKIVKAILPKIVFKARLFLILKIRLAFTQLKQTFIEVLILYHFDSERYIQIKTDASSYTIGGLLS